MLKLLLVVTMVLMVSKLAHAAVQTRDVRFTADGKTYQGYYAYDDATDAQRPGILVYPEWWGVNDYAKSRTRQLAELGYAALAVDVYGEGKTVDKPDVAEQLAGALKKNPQQLNTISQAALKALQDQDQVNPQQVAAIGYCFGGYAALELARTGAPLTGVVSFHGDLNTPNPDGAKNIQAKILILNGGDDPYVTAKDLENFKKNMRDAGVDWQLTSYGGAVHSFTNPQADSYHLDGIGYNPSADKRSWEAMKSFFAEIFGR